MIMDTDLTQQIERRNMIIHDTINNYFQIVPALAKISKRVNQAEGNNSTLKRVYGQCELSHYVTSWLNLTPEIHAISISSY